MKCGDSISFEVNYTYNKKICLNENAATSHFICKECTSQNESWSKNNTLSDSICVMPCILNCPNTHLILTPNFWIFTILTSLGSIFFNITNFFSDAICFDVLGL